MSILSPDYDMLNEISEILDEVNADYSNYLDHNHDIDDIDFLAELLNEKTQFTGLPIRWVNQDNNRANPNEWISASASTGPDGNSIAVILWHNNLENKWGPQTFKELVLKMLSHETIHFEQYNRIGLNQILGIESGSQKGQKLKAKTGKDRDYQRSYLRDSHELMAYGHDLSEEIKLSTNPEKALRNPEAFIEELPVYNQYRKIFPINAKPLKKLLSYAARYTNAIHSENVHI